MCFTLPSQFIVKKRREGEKEGKREREKEKQRKKNSHIAMEYSTGSVEKELSSIKRNDDVNLSSISITTP